MPAKSEAALRKKATAQRLYQSPEKYMDVVDITLSSDNPARSALHDELSNRALLWAANLATPRGLIGATEIEIKTNYLVDAIAIGALRDKFFRRYCQVPGGPPRSWKYHWLGDHLLVFEVKVTRRDFISTFGKYPRQQKNRHSPIGSLHWIVAPKGLAKKEEIPSFWGLLEADGKVLVESKRPILYIASTEIIGIASYLLLWYGSRRTRRRYTQIRTCPNCESTYSTTPEQHKVWKTIPQCWKCGPTAD